MNNINQFDYIPIASVPKHSQVKTQFPDTRFTVGKCINKINILAKILFPFYISNKT